MSKVSTTHWELAHAARWHLRKLLPTHSVRPDAVKVNGRVEHYHRRDGYRNVYVTARSKPLLIDLATRLRDGAAAIERGVRVYIDLGGVIPGTGEYVLDVSIFPGTPGTRKAVVEVAGQ